ncbi:MAG: rRNA maturation RNase YbeY [Hyphomicrobiales bacterium]|nr:rRNA maturation RNase YbeY [Hyphomicrobiales bacterium]
MELTFDISSEGWNQLENPEHLVRVAAGAAFEADGFDAADIELSVVLADDEFVADLNQRWRGKQGATNVLSFPVGEQIAHGQNEPQFIGDIVLASGVVIRQAGDAGKPLATHLSHLVVHGVLHLLGYDHQDDESAGRMQAVETAAMELLSLPDPYLEHEETAIAG